MAILLSVHDSMPTMIPDKIENAVTYYIQYLSRLKVERMIGGRKCKPLGDLQMHIFLKT